MYILLFLLTGLSLNEVTANSILFFLAGYDTTANTLTFLSYHLAMNKDIQDKCREEIERVLGKVLVPRHVAFGAIKAILALT